jgi:acyl carrier protein
MSLNAKLQTVFRDVFDDDALTLTDSLSQKTHSDWDSFQQVKLVIAIEEEFGVKLTTEEAISLTSVTQIKDWLQAHGVEA